MNNAGYPLCIVEAPYRLLGDFLSFELVPTRIEEIDNAIEKFRSNNLDEVEIEREDAVLTILPNGKIELDIWSESGQCGDSLQATLSDFEKIFLDWKKVLEKWDGYLP